jgi:pimeloyl-ACP methyl ester carboxylesterase
VRQGVNAAPAVCLRMSLSNYSRVCDWSKVPWKRIQPRLISPGMHIVPLHPYICAAVVAAVMVDACASLDVPEQQQQERAERTLDQLTVVGEIGSLADPRFDLTRSADGLWRPFDYMRTSHPGVYFLEPYDPNRTPVLFVHGIAGSPANFAYLIQHLDRTRFQAWVYNYPTGICLSAVADHLNQTIAKLEVRYRVPRIAVIAYSMGGLVARGFILRHALTSRNGNIPLFVSMSTPWEGHRSALLVEKFASSADVWRDLVPGSHYLQSLFAVQLPKETKFHLMFSFRRNSASFGESNDQTVTVASELGSGVQREAVRIYGFDDSHDGILEDPATSGLLDRLLAETLL